MKLSIIIPALNEADIIESTLIQLQDLRACHHEVIVVDGGSHDNTIELATPLTDKIIQAGEGRARQMNAGVSQATGDVYWFLHSDTIIPRDADKLIQLSLTKNKQWGRFNIRLSGKNIIFRVIEFMMNVRSCMTGIATGDQGIFVKHAAFTKISGYKSISLMEDIDISSRLLAMFGRPACIKSRLITSSRRWEKQGIVKTMVLMWRLRLAYFFGANPDKLAKRYSKI